MTGATYSTTSLRGLRALGRRGFTGAAAEFDRRIAVITQALDDEGVPHEDRPIRALVLDEAICRTAREETTKTGRGTA